MSYGLKQYLHWNTFTLGNGWQYLTQWDVHNYILDEKVNESFSGSILANKTVVKTSFFEIKLT